MTLTEEPVLAAPPEECVSWVVGVEVCIAYGPELTDLARLDWTYKS